MSTKPFTPLSKLPHFDARKVPIESVDSHLPPVSLDQLQPDALRQRFAAGAPWQPEVRQEPPFTDRSPMRASVLVPIVLPPFGATSGAKASSPTLLLTQRTAHLSTHSGQIAFPGGKADPEDADAAATALREAWEEVGLEARYVDVIGALPQYVTGTAFHITPVVALVRPGFTLNPNHGEVADVFEVPLDFLMDPANHRRHALQVDDGRREWFSMPWTDAAQTERFIWGATAGMLRNLYRFLSA
jgi:8-oxo-dGTP pyrophosphatase MutT (NUDIX family)